MAADMTNTILDYMVETLPLIFNAEFATLTQQQKLAQPLYLKSVIKHPLQDDPTIRAFYLAVSPDFTMASDSEHWRMPVQSLRRGKLGMHQDIPHLEVGGGFIYLNFFLIKGWLPMQSSREAAHEIAGVGLRRLERAFAMMAAGPMMQGLQTDDGMETTAGIYQQVLNSDGAHYEMQGGETEWYPQLTLRCHVYSQINREYYLGG